MCGDKALGVTRYHAAFRIVALSDLAMHRASEDVKLSTNLQRCQSQVRRLL